MKTSTFSKNHQSLSFNYGKLSVQASSIKYAESIYGNYTILKFANRKQILSSYTLNHYSSILKGSESFFNIRKGVLINLSFMKELDKRTDGTYAIMQDGSEFRLSRRKGKALIEMLRA
jgi:DNA-binding LytR/AlgR family response regulator